MAAHNAALCSLARRIQGLGDELTELARRIEILVARCKSYQNAFGDFG